MFTGIVQCIGDVAARRGSQNEARFVIAPRIPFAAPEVGESIAVNGVCLTAESFGSDTFTAYASGETLLVSTLAALRAGCSVNLERALTLQSRLGGHLVSGHVDCVATVAGVERKGDSTIFRIAFPPSLEHLVVPKGSVALDGVSLTVNECGRDFFSVNCIPETLSATVLQSWAAGTPVNMETDLVGKYVARLAEIGRPAPPREQGETPSRITMDFLRKNGF